MQQCYNSFLAFFTPALFTLAQIQPDKKLGLAPIKAAFTSKFSISVNFDLLIF